MTTPTLPDNCPKCGADTTKGLMERETKYRVMVQRRGKLSKIRGTNGGVVTYHCIACGHNLQEAKPE